MRVAREQIARSAEPRQKSHCRRSVEPGNVRAAPRPAVGGAPSRLMRAMEWQVHLERQMDVDRAGQKRKNAQREAHQEAEEIKVRPGHGTPRAHLVRELEFETQALLGATSTLPGRHGSVAERNRRRRMTAAPVLMTAPVQDFSEALG